MGVGRMGGGMEDEKGGKRDGRVRRVGGGVGG